MKQFLDSLGAYVQYLLPKQLLNIVAGSLASCRIPCLKNQLIVQFIKAFDVNMDEAVESNPQAFTSFNDFFTRAIRLDLRPMADSSAFVISPADGRISEMGRIRDGMLLQAKGRRYSLEELLGGYEALAEKFAEGEFMTIYLSPKDYHRVHMCATAQPLTTRFIPGSLFAVKPSAVRWIPRLFARNKRTVSIFQGSVGHFAQIMVGALIVGSIDLKPEVQDPKKQMLAGAEFGQFKLGSTVIMLFEAGKIEWLNNMQPGSGLKLGQAIARKLS